MPARLRVTNRSDAEAVLEELRRRGLDQMAPTVNEARIARLLVDQHEKQRAVDRDKSKKKALLTSRRGGKSVKLGKSYFAAAERFPGAVIPHISLTRKSAKLNLWPELLLINERYRFQARPNLTDLTLTFKNGSRIVLAGALNAGDIEKFRGGKHPLIGVDEAQSFGPHLWALVDEVLEPTLVDYDGEMVMAGTPNAACTGMFFDVTNGRVPGWSIHHWTILDNPYIKDAAGWLSRLRAEKGWTEDHPAYRREWKGEWVRSSDSLVYQFSDQRNVYRELPPGNFGWQFGIAVDLGFDDPTAIVLFRWCPELPNVYVEKVLHREKMIPSAIAGHIKQISKDVGGLAFCVVDQGGGAGKMIAEEFEQRWGIACKGAEKNKKAAFIELCNGDLLTGRVKIHETCGDLLDEIRVLQWDAEHAGKEDERFPNDCTDAFLYGYREARHYLHRDEEPPPAPGTPRYFEKMQQEMLEHAQQQMKRRTDPYGW